MEQIVMQLIISISVDLAKAVIVPTFAKLARHMKSWFK